MKNQKGFTLIELSIVLVIIGIILGAVLKGQDLIANARAKKLITTANSWNINTMGFLDRNGRFPGDESNDGIIGDVALTEQTSTTSAIYELANSTFLNIPANPLTLGSYSFWIYIGNTGSIAADSTHTVGKNCIVICKTSTCTGTFTSDEVSLIQSLDTAFDGLADAGLGQVRGATSVTLAGSGAWATINGRAQDCVTQVVFSNATTAGTATVWAPGTFSAAVWLFDKPF